MIQDNELGEDIIRADLLLTGGHSVSAQLHQDDPVLQQLLKVFDEDGVAAPPSFALQRVDGAGYVMLRSRDILTISIDRLLARSDCVRQTNSHLLIEDFLSPQSYRDLLDYTQQRQFDFTSTTITSQTGQNVVDPTRRISQVVYELPKFRALFWEKIYDRLPQVRQILGLDQFAVDHAECQLTAHGDGAFFRRHCDSDGQPNAMRTVSYVYYFFHEPKGFDGGALRLFANEDASHVDLTPLNNSIIFFSSNAPHEVLPVSVPSRKFADSRFTINGWIRRVAP